jgi:TonB family protein
MGRRLTAFLVLSLGFHAVAFSLFRDPGVLTPIPPLGSGRVILSSTVDGEGGLAELFDPSAIVLPSVEPVRLAGKVTLPWQGMTWPERDLTQAPHYRPQQIGQDVPLAVKATAAGSYYKSRSQAVKPQDIEKAGAKTWWELTGDLRKRKPTKSIQLPSMKSANALEPTTARIGVDEDGAVRYVFLEGSTGDPAVDREASTMMRTWRFEPSPGHWVDWGRVRVLWAVEAAEGQSP